MQQVRFGGKYTWAAVVAAAMLCALPALAYILPGYFILNKTAEWREKLKISTIHLRSTLEMGEGETRISAEAEEWIAGPALWRIDYRINGVDYSWLRLDEALYYKKGSEPVQVTKQPVDPLCLVICGIPGKGELRAGMQKLGVDLEKRRLERFNSRIAVAIGAEPNEPANQIWIDKDKWRPLRFLGRQKIGGKEVMVDERYINWQSPTAGEWFPLITERYEDGRLRFKRAVDSIDINQHFDEAVFKPLK